ncbi:MAG: hypothetical protein KQH83_08025 [Actinobacteria bacterium]|nr:hypothetical protein [Actinomycetota bacterium]
MAEGRRALSVPGPAYRHRQTSYPQALVITAAFAVLLFGLLSRPGRVVIVQVLGIGALGLYALVRLAWAAFDTEVTAEHVRGVFRPFGPGRTIPLDAITSAERVEFPWYFGSGGWMRIPGTGAWALSTWGPDAVLVHWRDRRGREKGFHFGTDDPDGLAAAVTAAIEAAGPATEE